MGAGTYDDTHSAWTYTGTWTALPIAGPYMGTIRYSNDPAATASFTFNGSAFVFTYLKESVRGNIEVWVDGVKVDTSTPTTIHALADHLFEERIVRRSPHRGLQARRPLRHLHRRRRHPHHHSRPAASGRCHRPERKSGTANGSVALTWTAPPDDAGNYGSGPAASYLVKFSTSPFASWSDGTLITAGVPAPAAPGTTQA